MMSAELIDRTLVLKVAPTNEESFDDLCENIASQGETYESVIAHVLQVVVFFWNRDREGLILHWLEGAVSGGKAVQLIAETKTAAELFEAMGRVDRYCTEFVIRNSA